MKFLSKYSKLILLFGGFIAAYIIFADRSFEWFHEIIISTGYLGAFVGGAMYAYGFTAGPGAAILIVLGRELDFVFMGLIGGLGGLLSDTILFKFLRFEFRSEINYLRREKFFREIGLKIPKPFKKYTLIALGCALVASPFPDEIGIAMLAASGNLNEKHFRTISLVLNIIGIMTISLFASTL